MAGPRIYAVGTVVNPTVYEASRNVVDLVATQRLAKHWELRAAWQDLFNQPVKLVQDSDRNDRYSKGDQTVRSFRRGSNTTLGVTYTW